MGGKGARVKVNAKKLKVPTRGSGATAQGYAGRGGVLGSHSWLVQGTMTLGCP